MLTVEHISIIKAALDRESPVEIKAPSISLLGLPDDSIIAETLFLLESPYFDANLVETKLTETVKAFGKSEDLTFDRFLKAVELSKSKISIILSFGRDTDPESWALSDLKQLIDFTCRNTSVFSLTIEHFGYPRGFMGYLISHLPAMRVQEFGFDQLLCFERGFLDAICQNYHILKLNMLEADSLFLYHKKIPQAEFTTLRNRAGRRLVDAEHVPSSLWPLIIYRATCINYDCLYSSLNDREELHHDLIVADVVFHLVKELMMSTLSQRT